MDDQRPADKRSLVTAELALCASLGMYVFFYIQLSGHIAKVDAKTKNVLTDYRVFKHQWEATLFRPAAAVESLLSRKNVEAIDRHIPL
jgi:hypothetical protein